MTKRFKETIIPWLFKWEGTKYENDPDDPGGATKYGIDQRSHPKVDIKNLTAEEAAQIYWDEYWIRCGCNNMKHPMDWIFFDTCVNCGFSRAQKIMKESGRDPRKFLDIRDDFYGDLAERRPRSRKFLKGWLNRTQDLRRVVFA